MTKNLICLVVALLIVAVIVGGMFYFLPGLGGHVTTTGLASTFGKFFSDSFAAVSSAAK